MEVHEEEDTESTEDEKQREKEKRKRFLEEQEKLKNREVKRPHSEPFSSYAPPPIGGVFDLSDNEGDDDLDAGREPKKAKKNNNKNNKKNTNQIDLSPSPPSPSPSPQNNKKQNQRQRNPNNVLVISSDEEEELSDNEAQGGINKREVQTQILKDKKLCEILNDLERRKHQWKNLKRLVDKGVDAVEYQEEENQKPVPIVPMIKKNETQKKKLLKRKTIKQLANQLIKETKKKEY